MHWHPGSSFSCKMEEKYFFLKRSFISCGLHEVRYDTTDDSIFILYNETKHWLFGYIWNIFLLASECLSLIGHILSVSSHGTIIFALLVLKIKTLENMPVKLTMD